METMIVDKIIDQIGVNELINTSTEPVQFKDTISFTISDEFREKSILNNIKLTHTPGICLTLNMYNFNKYYYFYVFIHDNKHHVVLLTLPPINASNQSDPIPKKYTLIGKLTDDKKIKFLLAYEESRELLYPNDNNYFDRLMSELQTTEDKGGKPKRSLRKRRKTKRRKSHRRRK